MIRRTLALWLLGSAALLAAELKVAVLHPLLGDLARQVGGENVEVVDLIGPDGDPHRFEPSPDDLRRVEGATLYLASGMGLEGYLPRLRSVLGDRAEIFEVGATLPALEGGCAVCDHGHHGHDHGHEIDPHWWHSIDLFRRATNLVADRFVEELPDRAEEIRANANAYRARLDELERWTKLEIARVPRAKRHLATAHEAFNYFCEDHGFTAHPVQGVNREQMPTARQLATLIENLREHHVAAIFPEKESNPKILETLTADTGIRLGEPLIADGAGVESYEEMIRHNVGAIVRGLAP